MATPQRIVVTGATGKTGSEVLRLLLEVHEREWQQGITSPTFSIALAVRSEEKGRAALEAALDSLQASYVSRSAPPPPAELDLTSYRAWRAAAAAAVQVVMYDQTRPATFAAVVTGTHALYAVAPKPGPWSVAELRPLWRDAVAAGVRHVTFLSNAANEVSDRAPHAAMERDLRAACAGSTTTWTFLRAEYFMQNLLRDNGHCIDIREHSELYAPAGEAQIAWIDDRDVAAAAVVTLLHPDAHANAVYLLTGPELCSYRDVARELTEALGRPVPYTPAWSVGYGWRKGMQGVATDFVIVQLLVFAAVRSGVGARTTDVLPRLLRDLPLPLTRSETQGVVAPAPMRVPRTVRDFVREYAAAGAWTPRGKLVVQGFD